MTLRVMTPRKKVLETEATQVVLRCADGDMGVLPRHEPFAAVLQMGMIKVYEGRDIIMEFFALGGIVTFQDDVILVMSEMAGGPGEVEESLRTMEAALEERRQEEARSSAEVQRAEVALRNALVHMQIGSYALTGDKANKPGEEAE